MAKKKKKYQIPVKPLSGISDVEIIVKAEKSPIQQKQFLSVVKHYKFSDDLLEHVHYTIRRKETNVGSRDNWNLTISKPDMDALREVLNRYEKSEPLHPKENR